MSIILDALKKADSERRVGELPGLQSIPVALGAMPDTRRQWQRPILALGTIALLAAIVAWFLAPGKTGQSTAVIAPVASIDPAPAGQQHASVPVQRLAALPTIAASEVPTPPPLPVAPKSSQVAKQAEPLDRRTPSVLVEKEMVKSVVRLTQTPTPVRAPVPAPVRPEPASAMSLAQLPPQIRAELPAFSIGGSMYSGNPADRMLLVDKRMLHEGDEIAPGLLLEMIQPKSAILRYKGYTFRLPL